MRQACDIVRSLARRLAGSFDLRPIDSTLAHGVQSLPAMPDPPMPNDRAGSPAQRAAMSARDGVVRALERVERGERNGLDRLRSALCAYVRVLRDSGASSEEVIDAVRVVVSTPVNSDARFGLLHPARVALVELSVHWCTEEYANQRSPAPPAERRPIDNGLDFRSPRSERT